MKLYKYCSISGDAFKHTQDIFVNQRLFLSKANMLNDPNEGIAVIDIKNDYRIWGNQHEERNRQDNIRICAFSETHKNSVMWSHYADEHKGICIEMDDSCMITDRGILKKVNYSNSVPILKHSGNIDSRDLFLNKTEEWAYEKEWRYIEEGQNSFLFFNNLAITRVLIGVRFEKSNLEWIKFWIKSFNQDIEIPIVQMKFAPMDYNLYEEHEMTGLVQRK